MNYNYYCPKLKYLKNKEKYMYLFFDNGDFLEIKYTEIIDFSFRVYDKLVRSYQGYNPVAKSGYVKLRICNKHAFVNTDHRVYNEGLFRKNRKEYIENRCVSESRITEIWLFDENSWHKVLHCEAKGKIDGDFLIIEILEQPQMGDFESDKHCVSVGDLKKEDIHHIDLDFENCESFYVYQDEIEEINVEFDNCLEWGAEDFYRKVIGGYLKIKLNENYNRYNALFERNKKLKNLDFEKRLCGKNGEDIHDICHLYVCYDQICGTQREECIEVDDIKTEESKRNFWSYESGYCKKLQDGSIMIAFGKDAKTQIDNLK